MFKRQFLDDLRWEFRELGQAFLGLPLYKTLLAMALGIGAMGVAVNGIIIPQGMVAPGISGISLLIFYYFGWPSVGVLYLLVNIPLFIIGWREYALKYVFLSLTGALMLSASLELTRGVVIATPDPLMAALMAGVIMGFGAGFYLRAGGSAGGLDIVATLVKKKFAIPMGQVFVAVNAINLLGNWVLGDANTTLYSALFMGVFSWAVDMVQTGFSQRRAVIIITDHPKAVAEGVVKRLNRGVTFLHGAGSRSGDPKEIIYTVINMIEMGRLKEMLFQIDPAAFVVVHHTAEVIGHRFLTWEEEGYRRLHHSKGEK